MMQMEKQRELAGGVMETLLPAPLFLLIRIRRFPLYLPDTPENPAVLPLVAAFSFEYGNETVEEHEKK